MALTPEQRAELAVLGPETVRVRLRSSDLVTVISGFKTPTTRSDLEGWLTEKSTEGKSDRRQWWWAFQAFAFVSLVTAVVLLSVDLRDRLLVIYGFSSAVGWLAGAVAYFGVACVHNRETKQWLPLGVSVAALAGLIWRLHYTVRFDVALTAAALIGPMPPVPMVAPAPVTAVAPVAPAPVTSAEPVAPAPVTTVVPALNPHFTCTRMGNVTVCK